MDVYDLHIEERTLVLAGVTVYPNVSSRSIAPVESHCESMFFNWEQFRFHFGVVEDHFCLCVQHSSGLAKCLQDILSVHITTVVGTAVILMP